MFKFEFETFRLFYIYLVRLKNRVWLSHDVQVAGVVWRATMRIVIRVEDLLQRTMDDRICQILNGRTIRRSDDIVCDLHRAYGDEDHMFLG
jgi:hypothetical protein